MLCRLVSDFNRACEKGKFRVNVGKSKVMRCSRYGNRGRMHVILNGKPLDEVDVAADGGYERHVVQRMNEGYRAREVLKSVLRNRGLGIKGKK